MGQTLLKKKKSIQNGFCSSRDTACTVEEQLSFCHTAPESTTMLSSCFYSDMRIQEYSSGGTSP